MLNQLCASGVTTTGAEVLSGTTNVPITCTISGVESTPTVTWKQDTTDIATNTDFTVGAVELTGNTASAVLTVLKASIVDTIYTCLVTSAEWEKTDDATTVAVDVFSELLSLTSS